MFNKYLAYIKDNPKGYWFKAKPYGFGWIPVKWQGWVSILIFAAIILLDFKRIDANSHSASDTVRIFALHLIILVVVFRLIIGKKGEKMKWQWGIKK